MIGVCVTTRNEAETIGELVRPFVEWDWRVFVCDANSDDDTWRVANDAGANVNVNYHRVPMAEGYRRAWQMALEAGCDLLLQCDAGGSHNPMDAPGLVGAWQREKADMVIGSRFCKGARYLGNPGRRRMSRLAAVLMNLAQSGAHYTDWTSGYRLVTRAAATALLEKSYRGVGHEWQIEVLAYAGELGFKIVECPITYTAGRSSFDKQTTYRAALMWTHVFFHVPRVNEERRNFAEKGIGRAGSVPH